MTFGDSVQALVFFIFNLVSAFLPFMIVHTLSYGLTVASIQKCWKHLEAALNQIAPQIDAVLMTKP